MRILDIPKLSRNAKGYSTPQTLEEHGDIRKKNSHVNCFITYMFTGILFTTEDMKKDEVQVPQ